MKLRVLVVVLVVLPLLMAQAHADDHAPPDATLRHGSTRQEGLRYHAEWVRPNKDPRFCTTQFSDSWPSFRKAIRYSGSDQLVVRLHKASMPTEVEAYRWERIGDEGYGRGDPTPLPSVLRAVVVNGETRGWEVVVVQPSFKRHLYLGVRAYWSDEDECTSPTDLGSQGAGWTFHVKRRS